MGTIKINRSAALNDGAFLNPYAADATALRSSVPCVCCSVRFAAAETGPSSDHAICITSACIDDSHACQMCPRHTCSVTAIAIEISEAAANARGCSPLAELRNAGIRAMVRITPALRIWRFAAANSIRTIAWSCTVLSRPVANAGIIFLSLQELCPLIVQRGCQAHGRLKSAV